MKELEQKQAHEDLGVTAVIEKLKHIQELWTENNGRYEEDERRMASHATEMREAISRATASLEESLQGFITQREELDGRHETSSTQFGTDAGLCHVELDEILEVSSDNRYHSHGRSPEFELRREHTNVINSCTSAIQAKLEYEDPVAYQTKVLDDAIFEFESALRLTTTTKQANIVWNDVQQFLVEFEESLENDQEEEESTEEGSEAGTTSVNS